MKIKKVILDNIRCFDHIEFDLNWQDEALDWVVIVGDNGVGKSTILRSIALGLAAESDAAGLLSEMVGDWVRIGESHGWIEIELEPYPGCKEEAKIRTDFRIESFDEVKVRQEVSPEKPVDFTWDDLFVCGYGASRSDFGTETYSEYNETDAVYTLFKYSHPLQNPELNIRRIESLKINVRDIFKKLEKIMLLEPGSITMDFSGIKISGPWGSKMLLGALGDGYKAMFAMMMDAIGWRALLEGDLGRTDISRITSVGGIIIIDEIEQHLHPQWQKKIIGLLQNEFPKIQFIVSTHSSLCAVGTTDLTDKECGIISLDRNGTIIESRMSSPPRTLRVDQVLTSYLFDLATTSDNLLKQSIAEYAKLYSKPDLDEQHRARFIQLQKLLDEKIGSAETDLEKKVSEAVDEALDDLINKKLLDSKNHLQYEVLRQLREISKEL